MTAFHSLIGRKAWAVWTCTWASLLQRPPLQTLGASPSASAELSWAGLTAVTDSVVFFHKERSICQATTNTRTSTAHVCSHTIHVHNHCANFCHCHNMQTFLSPTPMRMSCRRCFLTAWLQVSRKSGCVINSSWLFSIRHWSRALRHKTQDVSSSVFTLSRFVKKLYSNLGTECAISARVGSPPLPRHAPTRSCRTIQKPELRWQHHRAKCSF